MQKYLQSIPSLRPEKHDLPYNFQKKILYQENSYTRLIDHSSRRARAADVLNWPSTSHTKREPNGDSVINLPWLNPLKQCLAVQEIWQS